MELIGFQRSDFMTPEGQEVKGAFVFLSRPIPVERGQGVAVERVYISDRKAMENGVNLAELLGKKVLPMYTRNGKLETILRA